jgi:hypothetical protein
VAGYGLLVVVVEESSFLVTVPSGDWVTVFSFDLTVPSLLVLLLSVWEIVRSHPTIRNDNANVATTAKITVLPLLICCFIGHNLRDGLALGYGV